jgi:AraC family transcriptional regulator
MTMLFRPSGYRIEGCYRDESVRRRDRIGQIFFIPPNVELFGWGTGGDIKAARCVFDPDFYARTVGRAQLTTAQLRSCLDMQGTLLPAILTRLMEEALSPGFAGRALAECLGGALLIEWARHVLHAEAEGPARGGLTPRQRRLVEERLEDEEDGIPAISDLASLCGMSERHFCRLFREETGTSIGKYLNSLQIRRAQRLLLDSELPLKEIAFRLGFANPANFSSAFRAATNQPPGAFRRQFQRSSAFLARARA